MRIRVERDLTAQHLRECGRSCPRIATEPELEVLLRSPSNHQGQVVSGEQRPRRLGHRLGERAQRQADLRHRTRLAVLLEHLREDACLAGASRTRDEAARQGHHRSADVSVGTERVEEVGEHLGSDNLCPERVEFR
jgi:hypothetical protein